MYVRSLPRLARAFAVAAFASVAAAQNAGTALVRHAPTLNGAVEGSIHQMTAEAVTLNGGASVTGSLLVPGTPSVRLNGKPSFGGTMVGDGAAAPTTHAVVLNGNVRLGRLDTRTDPLPIGTVGAPPAPRGTRSAVLNFAGAAAGDFATIRNLTLNGSVGEVAVPAGVYGEFIANGTSGFTLGVAGATEPSVYAFQRLTLNGKATLHIAGPVIVTLANGFAANGAMGLPSNPEWLVLRLAAGDFTLNGNVSVYAYVNAPSGTVTVNGRSLLAGGVTCDRLVLNGSSTLRLIDSAPSVRIVSPVDGSIFGSPAPEIVLQASASDTDGTVTKVEFFAGDAKIGQAITAPYSFSWKSVAAGRYSVVAKAADNAGCIVTSAPVEIVVNAPPTVGLDMPSDHSVVASPASLTLRAHAADADGAIAKVEFFAGETKLGECLNAPYELAVSGIPAGTYAISARATDNLAAVTVSPTKSLIVDAPPSVALTSPGQGAVIVAPATFVMAAAAADADGTIAKVEFFAGTEKLGEATHAPLELTWSGVPSGTYSLVARATDNLGISTSSAPVAVVSNAAPFVALTSPAQNAVFPAASSITLVADARDAEGAIAKVEFFAGEAKLGEAVAAPYQLTWKNVPPDTYSLTARITDVGQAATVSQPIAIRVTSEGTEPTATGAQADVLQGQSVTVTLHGRDQFAAPLTFEWLDLPKLGTMSTTSSTADSVTITYVAGAGSGIDSIHFRVTNGQSRSAAATLSIRVLPGAPTPVGETGTAGGTVFDAATKQPIPGVLVQVRDEVGGVVTENGGGYSATVSNFNGYATKYAYVSFSAPGYITSYRKFVAYADAVVPIDPVYLKKRDTKITIIGSQGGIATNTAGDVVVEIPAAATTATVPVQATNYDAVHELPGYLPESSAFTYAVDLSPDGTTFTKPVTVKIANSLGFSPGTPIPIGLFNPRTVQWEPECGMATVSADGRWVMFQATHFSERDINVPVIPKAPTTDGRSPKTPSPLHSSDTVDPRQKQRDPGVGIGDGSYETEIGLPAFTILNRQQQLRLVYESEQGTGQKLVEVNAYSDKSSASPLAREVKVQVGSVSTQATFKGESAEAYGSFRLTRSIDLSSLKTGFHRSHTEVTNLYDATYALTSLFGGSPIADTGVAARQPARLGAKSDGWLAWVNRRESEFGSGWGFSGLERLYSSPERSAVMTVGGDGSVTRYVENATGFVDARKFETGLLITDIAEANDGGILVAHHHGLIERKRDGSFTTLVDGVDAMGSPGTYGPDPDGGGIMSVAQSATGTIYFTFYTSVAMPGSPLTQPGLYRIDPCSGIKLVSGALARPAALTMDRRGICYVFDQESQSIWRVTEDGAATLFTETGWINRLFYEQTSDRMFVSGAGLRIYTSDGQMIATAEMPEDGRHIIGNVFTDSDTRLCCAYEDTEYNVRLMRFGPDGRLLGAPSGAVEPAAWPDGIVSTRTGDFVFFRGDVLYVSENSALKQLDTMNFVSEADPGVSLSFGTAGRKWRKQDLSGNVSDFDESGTLLRSSDRYGNQVTYAYDAAGRLITLNYTPGGSVTLVYDSAGRLKSITDIAGRTTSFAIDGDNNLTGVQFPDGSTRSFAYNEQHAIVRKTDPRGLEMRFTVDEQGRYTKITYPDGTTTSFSAQRLVAAAASDPFVAIGRDVQDPSLPSPISEETVDGITDQLGGKSAWVVDARGYLETTVGVAGDARSSIWDSTGRLIVAIDGNENRTEFTYDNKSNIVDMRRVAASGFTAQWRRFYYDGPFNQVSLATDPNWNWTQFVYDDATGALQQVIDPAGKTTSFESNSRGQITKIIDPLGRARAFGYNAGGNLASLVDPANAETRVTRDAAGNITDIVDPLGRHTTATYDAMNRVTSISYADGGSVTFGYDANGNRTSVTDQKGHTIEYEYDVMDNVTKITAPDGAETVYRRDVAGRVTAITDPNGNTRTFGYDGSGRLIDTTDGAGVTRRFELDGNGNVRVARNADWATSYSYDALNRMVFQKAPDGGATTYKYDDAGNLLELIDPKEKVSKWEYDELNRVVAEIDRLGKSRTFAYDDTGRLVTEINRRGQTLTRSYDPVGRLQGLSTGADTIGWTYDLAGQLKTASNSAGQLSMAYDAVGRLSSVDQAAGAIAYRYDKAGNRLELVDALGTTGYQYDALNRLTHLTDTSGRGFVFSYDRGSRLSGLAYPNGIGAVYTYDAADQLLSLTHMGGTRTIAATDYTYDKSGNRTSETREDIVTRSFAYDPNFRVQSAVSSAPAKVPAEAFAYDTLGNWTTDSRVHNDAHELVEDGSFTYTYDEDGNLTEKRSKTNAGDVTTYTWDPLNRLTTVRTAAAQLDFTYDALGRRASRTQTDLFTQERKVTRFVYDGDNVRLEVSGDGTVLAANTHAGLDALLVRTDFAAGTTHFLHADGLGSTIAVTDAAGQVTERYRYSVFGAMTVLNPDATPKASGLPVVPYTYTGRDWEPAAGMYNYRARYYSPNMGRFISADPIGFSGGDMNTYAYTSNAPIDWNDPFGLDVYRQNRQLNPKGKIVRDPVEHFVSHTFVYTTNHDGSIKDTYSWGNAYDEAKKGIWSKNAIEDRSATREAIRQRREYEAAGWWDRIFLPDNFGERVGDATLDPEIDVMFSAMKEEPRHEWKLTNNCKNEADRLIERAQAAQRVQADVHGSAQTEASAK